MTNNNLIDSLNSVIAGLQDGIKDDPKRLFGFSLFIDHLEYIKEKIEKGEWSCDIDFKACTSEVKRMTREEVLETAKKCVCGQREQDYGTPESNFKTIAKLWNDYLDAAVRGIVITPTDVAMMMSLLKIARIKNGGGTGDSFVDLAGYAACGGELNAIEKKGV